MSYESENNSLLTSKLREQNTYTHKESDRNLDKQKRCQQTLKCSKVPINYAKVSNSLTPQLKLVFLKTVLLKICFLLHKFFNLYLVMLHKYVASLISIISAIYWLGMPLWVNLGGAPHDLHYYFHGK